MTDRYSAAEATAFSQYTELLVALCAAEMGGFDGVTLGVQKCVHCSRTVPSGMPRQLKDSEWIMCPACTAKRRIVPALRRRIYGEGAHLRPSSDEAKTMVKDAVARAQSTKKVPSMNFTKLKRGIARIEEQLTQPHISDRERAMSQRLLDVMKRALERQGG